MELPSHRHSLFVVADSHFDVTCEYPSVATTESGTTKETLSLEVPPPGHWTTTDAEK
jgi:hypothetical protein